MRRLVIASAGLLLATAVTSEARQCYRRVVEPPRYTTVEEQVLLSPARDAAETIPAVTREVEETVVIRPARTQTRVIPAEYGDEERTVEVAPAHREWRTRDEDGEVIGCWVNAPARYARLSRRVLTTPARAVEEMVPAETATRPRTVVIEPARTIWREIPARYATRERTVMASPGGPRWAPLDACD